ncbi:MAG: cation:proton antiporter [Bacteroidota bacterium]|jgi:Kef-type K+ transport system membrane component KefB
MGKLTHQEFISLLLAMGAMLFFARLAAEGARLLKLPVVTGEILVGVLLGPSFLGHLYPTLFAKTFPLFGEVGVALDGITKISAVLLLFVSGMELQMQLLVKQGRAAVTTSLLSLVIPFLLGFSLAYYLPGSFEYIPNDGLLFALFMGTAMSISALPVIAKTLMDLNMLKSKVGMIIIAAAMFDDLIGWLVFSLIISLLGKGRELSLVLLDVSVIIGYGILMLTIGKKLIDKSLPWIQKKLSWPGGVLSLALSFCFFSAAFTEYLGIHAVLGAFIAGIAVGDSVKLNTKAREIIHQFVTNIFAPLFFVSIGIKINFIAHFDASVTLMIFLLASLGKITGATLGARAGLFPWRESVAIGFGLNARGAMEIILGTLALQVGLINETIFVALVIMAIVTSIASGPVLRWLGTGRESVLTRY